MAFSLDSNPTSPTFNCYVSVTEATDYFASRFGADSWDDFTTAQKEALLATASRELDNLRWQGLKASSTQPMSWPRQLLEDWEGNSIPNSVIPKKLKEATCELALWKWTEDDRWFSDADLGQIQSYQVPGVNVQAKSNPERFPSDVNAALSSIGPGVVSLSSNKAQNARIGL